MASVNKVILVGNLGKDPELKYTPNGTAVASFSIATTEKWSPKGGGDKQSHTEWHKIVAWGKLAEICGEYLAKGKQVYIEGAIRSRTFKGKDGADKTIVEIRADNLVMLGKQSDVPERVKAEEPAAAAKEVPKEEEPSFSDDDIPF